MIKIICLSKETEDCFYVEIKFDDSTTLNILVDGGKNPNVLIEFLKYLKKMNDSFRIDYIIVTHIDNDHIKGIINLYYNMEIISVIENSTIIYNYIVDCPEISYKQAEEFEKIIKNKQVIVTYKKNYKFKNNQKIMFLSYEDRINEEFSYEKIINNRVLMTFLNPTYDMVLNVHSHYYSHKLDSTWINRSSIAFLFEYKDKVLLFTGDCYLEDIISKVNVILMNFNGGNEKIKTINFIKIPHHGSNYNNNGIDELMSKFKCENIYITCSKNDIYHPNPDFIEKIKCFDKLNVYVNNDNLNVSLLKKCKCKVFTEEIINIS